MKNLLNNLLNWVLKKGPSETKKDQAWGEKEQAGSKKDQVKRTKLEMGSEAREVRGSEAVSANHALITQLSRNNHPRSLRAIRYAAMIFAVLVMSVANVGVAWGASPLTWASPDATSKTQDGVTIQGYQASQKIANSNQNVLYTGGYSSIFIYSQATNITSISFDVCNTSDGAGAASFDVQTSSGAAYSIPSSFTATKDGAALASLTNINVKGQNQAAASAVSITFDSPVKAIMLSKNGKDIRVRNFNVTYNAASTPTTYFAAHVSGTNAGTIDTNPGGASTTVSTASSSNTTTVGSLTYYKLNNGVTIDLGTGHSFQAGDQIVVDIAGGGTNKTPSVGYYTGGTLGSGTLKATLSAGKVTNAFGTKFAYVVTTGDGIIGTQAAYFKISTDTRVLNYYVLRAAPSCSVDHVDVTGSWHIWNEGSMALTATAYDDDDNVISSDITYQWYKGGTEEGNKIVGATSATYSKDNCNFDDAGYYYCKVSAGGGCDATSGGYAVKMLRVYVKSSKSGSDYGFIDLTDIGSYESQGVIRLATGGQTYGFGISDGCGDWYGNDGTMTSSTCTDWSMDKNADCGLTSTSVGSYTFTVKFGNLYDSGTYGDKFKVSINYPSNNQAANKVIYFDNSDLNWSNIYYRIGKSNHNQNSSLTAVPGTAHLYKVTTSEYGGLEAWHIANNTGWSGSNSIYKTKTNDGYAITAATEFDGAAVTDAAITILPQSGHYKGGTDENNNCDFYYYNLKKFLVTHTATISATTNGSVRLNWTDVSGTAQNATSTTAGLAHTCNLQVTAVPATGYETATLTVNGSNHTSGTVHVLSTNATIAATFSLVNYNITYSAPSNGNYTIEVADGGASSATKTATMGQTVAIVATPADASYEFTGWTVTNTSSSADVTSTLLAGDKATTASTNFTMPAYGVTIVATFAKKTYTVTYNKGTGDITGSHANDTKTHGVNLTLPGATFSKTGYTQTGWATEEGGGKVYELSGSYTANAAADLYPVWTAKTSAITLEAGEGGTDGSATATYGSSSLASLVHATRTGYTQDGYETSGKVLIIKPNGTLNSSKSGYTDGTTWINESSLLTLYARWSATSYTLSYDLAGGNVASDNPTGYTIESSAITLNNPTKTGYTFAGWTGTGLVSATTTVTIAAGSTGNRSYTATWTPIVPSSVSLNKTSTTITVGGTETLTATISPAVVADNTITWTSSDETVATVTSAGVVTGVKAGTATITATTHNDKTATCEVTVAPAVTYTVTYNAQGGSVTPSSETVSTATLPTPTKSGYTFDGWYTSGGSKITGTYNPTADITLYAQWQSTDCDAGGTTTLADINFKNATWSGKTFSQGNTTNTDEINDIYFYANNASKQFSLTDNTTKGLTFPDNNISSGNYYFCIPITGINSKQITITLKHGYDKAKAQFKYVYVDGRTEYVAGNTNGSGGTAQSDTNNSDTEITFTLSSLKNTAGHLMIGRSSSSYTNIYGVTVTTPGAAGTCYYVTYNGNGATGGYTTDEAAYASGDNATAATNSFTKTGYTFKEWRTNPKGTGTKYEAGDPIAISGNITLYAIWQAAGYTLAWNSNGGSDLSGTYSSGSLADGATITAPDDPTRANYTFDSWNTAADGSGNAFTGTMPAANTTYYAVWKNTLTLETGSQGSESDKAPKVFLGGSGLKDFSAHKAAGYTLQGYYTAATGGTKVLNADGSFAASNIARFVTSGKWSRTTGDTTLVAQWESSYLLKWNLQLNKAEDAISTTSKESATARVTTASMTNLTNNGELTITSSKKTDLTSQIETPINLTVAESKYMSVSFDVTAGYQLLPSAVKVMVQPVGNGENKYAKLILEDENSHSISTVVECEGTEKGKKTTVTLNNADGTVFTGTVTLKILVYNKSGASTTNNCYRLGSPIQIDGAIEAACELPSYEGLEYDQTEYTVGVDEASAIRVTGGSADTYQWKWNSTNDRSTGTVVGTNNANYTPLITISEVGTRYYWCELKNDDCDGVVKTPVVAVTVSSAVTATTVTWTEPENEPNYGGGGYVIRATVDQTGWGGTLGESNLVAPAGIHITNVATGTDDGKQYIEATFDVTTAFDRDKNEVIVFGLTHDAVTGYSAISVTDTIDYDACSGGEEGSAAIALTSTIHDEGSGNAPRYWFETIGVGRVFGLNYGKATLGTSSDATFNAEGYSYVASSTSQRWVFQPYVEGVTKIRIYIKSATNTLRVLSIGKNASWQDQSSKYSNIAVDTIIYSNGKTTGLDNNQTGYAEIQFSSALTKDNYYMFTMNSSSTYIYGVTLYSGSVGDGGNLATSLTFANIGPIDADASTANFQNIASKSGENSNTLGTITYSSNNDAATVNARTGEVSIHAKETAQVVTITATLSASGCYQGATATYTINVAADACDEPSGSIELTTGSATKCSGESVILTMTGFTSGATVEWYNGDTKVNDASGYTIVTSGSTSTLETSNAGTYSAIAKVDGGCPSGAGRTNSITISNIAVDASATKIVDKWYVKNGRSTPDIALWQLSEGATLEEVTIERNVSGEGSLGLTSSDFVARDGIVYLSGKEPSANETGADVEYTLTLTVKDACDGEHEMTEKTITLTHQKNTDKHVLAFVVNGTAKGGFTDGITAAQTTSVGLYNAIAAQFDVLATNIYATDDEKKLKEYYSQFDILCITDYPNTQTKGANSKSYVDAIGSLIDIRPILTMEAFVSKLANWKAKGISGNPKSPTTRQYTMDLQCKDHEIFAGTKLTKVGEGDEAMYRVSMVDNTLEDYATLDATYGAILPHKEKESKSGAGDGEYNYGGKPALQGFTFTQEMSDNDLLPIGLIEDGAGNPLQVGIERQHNMEARLMVLGINSYAMERLTDDGERVVINALNYLMKKNQEDIADCSTSFVGGAEGDTKNWDNADNWTGNTVPLPTQKVRILADCEVSSTVYAQSVLIVTGGKYNHGSDIAAGKLTIKENGALIVGGKIQAASAPAYNRPRATTPDKLLIETSSTNQAALIFDNEEAETQATVHLYSLGRKPSSYQYQYFAVPMEVVPVNPAFANETHGGTGIYTYVYEEASSGWTRRKYYDDLFAFEGLGITTKSTVAMNYTMTGNLASTATKEITLTHDGAGLNLIGNSWMAPIQIGALAEDNTDANITKTVYIYCAGRDAVEGAATSGDTETAGQWIAIPFEASGTAGWRDAGKLSVIPAMQAFQIKVSDEATLTLDYDKVVRGSTNDLNAKLRAPGRRMAANEVTMTNIRVADSKTHTDLSLFEGDRFSEAFDNGWEAEYMNGDGRSAKLYAETEAGQMAVVAMYDYEGTVVGFAPGQETEYTFSFMGEDNGYYLNDIKLQNSVRISEGETYTFTYEEGDAANRFYISRTAINAPEIATGVDNTSDGVKAQKILYNDKLYIIVNGRVYSATGGVVR